MGSVYKRVDDFNVIYKQGAGNNVEVYIDGDLIERNQPTWFMSELFKKTLQVQEENRELKKKLGIL